MILTLSAGTSKPATQGRPKTGQWVGVNGGRCEGVYGCERYLFSRGAPLAGFQFVPVGDSS